MRILINDFAGHPFPLQLGRSLASRGHDILQTYFAANNCPKGAVVPVSSDPASFAIQGLTIPFQFEKHKLRTRRSADIAYGREVAAKVASYRPDIVLSANMPLDAQAILMEETKRLGVRFVFWLQDVYSEAVRFVLSQRRIPFASMAAAYYRRLEKQLLQRSDGIVCISPDFRDILNSWGLPMEKIRVIENWAPLAEMPQRPRQNAWSRENGLDGKFVFLYSGTLGKKHIPEMLLELAKRFEDDNKVALVVIAEGAGADWLRTRLSEVRPGALRMMGFQPYDRVPEALATADALIVLLDPDCGRFAVPSKALTYLCAGRPILASAPVENLTSNIIERSGAGLAVPAGDVAQFVCAAERLLSDEGFRDKCSRNARAYAEHSFDVDQIVHEFLTLFSYAMRTDREQKALATQAAFS